ncbi:hypothetical protein [Paenibacillus chungangensis]|uniref:Uncharacterized protein n=1 Tax=Paenibacillus chungangensis TaxID=696535 RepID=A0ABW3HLH7_9BACL
MKITGNKASYAGLLERWVRGMKPYLYHCPDRPDLCCYGTGEGDWGVQTNQKAFAAVAMLAVEGDNLIVHAGMSKEELTKLAVKLLRFSLESHLEGSYHCTDGSSWGHTWISALGIERMMHGVDAIDGYLMDKDRLLLRKVLISECDWLLDRYTIIAGMYHEEHRNKPESNLWNGSLLYRTALMYPDAPRAAEYKDKADRFLVNAISVSSDALSDTLYNHRKVSDLHIDANFFDSYALNHHGYLNVGYMVICLSNAAMLHFKCRSMGWAVPEALTHHLQELWEVVKAFTFPDGRLLRIGGDTRIRYSYCQDYVIPVWLLARDLYEDHACSDLETGWLKQIVREMDASGDGTFFSARCTSLARRSPLYFTRLESDRAAALSMGLAWESLIGSVPSVVEEHQPVHYKWHDSYHGAYLQRSEDRIASWVWRAAEKPQGLCVPSDASHMAEWRENLAGELKGLGQVTEQKIDCYGGDTFDDGFITWGSTVINTRGLLAEGKQEEDIARNKIVCAVLPDNTHMVVLQQAKTLSRRCFVQSVKGLHLVVPNDIFNDNYRKYTFEGGSIDVQGMGSMEEAMLTGSQWINIDNHLGIIAAYGAEELTIYRPGKRQIGLKHDREEGSLYADEICGICEIGLQSFDANQEIWDAGYILQSNRDGDYTGEYCRDAGKLVIPDFNHPDLRGVELLGADGQRYMVIANFGMEAVQVNIPDKTELQDLTDHSLIQSEASEGILLTVPAGEGRIYRVPGGLGR